MILKMISVNKEKNRKRFYVIEDLQLSLFNDRILNIHWGRIGYRGRHRTLHFETQEDYDKMLVKLLRKRKSHQYIEVDEIPK